MGYKLEKLIKTSRKEDRIFPFDTFLPKSKKGQLVHFDIGYGLAYKYNFLARFLPDFIEELTIEKLKSTPSYKESTTGGRLKLLMQLKSRQDIEQEMIIAIKNRGTRIVQKYFLPKSIQISLRALEQYNDFIKKYHTVKNTILKSQHRRSTDQKFNEYLTKIFISSKYDPDLFFEYFKHNSNFNDPYIYTGLNIYHAQYNLSIDPDHTVYAKMLYILKSKLRSFDRTTVARTVHTYREYFKHYLQFKDQKKKDYKIAAIKTTQDCGYSLKSIDEITKIFTAFFNFMEISDLHPFEKMNYLDYLCDRFPFEINKRKKSTK